MNKKNLTFNSWWKEYYCSFDLIGFIDIAFKQYYNKNIRYKTSGCTCSFKFSKIIGMKICVSSTCIYLKNIFSETCCYLFKTFN